MRVGHAFGLVGLGACRVGRVRCLFAFGTCGVGLLAGAFGFLGADLRLQALAFEFRARLRGIAAREGELDAIVLALQGIALVFERFGFGARARDSDASLGQIDLLLAPATPSLLELFQRRARTLHLCRRAQAQHPVRSEAVKLLGKPLVGVIAAARAGVIRTQHT